MEKLDQQEYCKDKGLSGRSRNFSVIQSDERKVRI